MTLSRRGCVLSLGGLGSLAGLAAAGAAIAACLLTACASGPPREKGPFRGSDLVEIVVVDPAIALDIRYATANNFLGRPVYSEARAFLQRPAALALSRVRQRLASQGFGLKVFDGYRPWSVTKVFWDSTSPDRREFVADPRKGSRHNRGCAVDLTLFDLASGSEVEMPSPYDDFSERAHPGYTGGSPASRAHRDLLRAAMEAEGFTVYDVEWWHFDFRDWREYAVQNVAFDAIERAR